MADEPVSKPEQNKRSMIGTASYENWCAFATGEPVLGEHEYLLYTDAWLTGQVPAGLGPYAFLNLIPLPEKSVRVRAAFVLRLALHILFDAPNWNKTDQSRYHGGEMEDEIVALASLKCGVRLRAGGQSRWFDVGGDPKGRPVARSVRPEPSLNFGGQHLVLPTVTGEHSIMSVEEMRSFPMLSAQQAIALVRSARLYQDALWIAESEPNLSWLLLVSAVETAANLWRSKSDSPLDRLKDSRPDFVEYLNGTGFEGLADCVATEFTQSIGVGKKFRDFLLEYLPKPPEKRPPGWVQIDWSTDNLRRAFNKIYEYRSKALHDGMPFPAPMCEPPARFDQSWEAFAERPYGLGSSQSGGVWLAKDIPMLLHTFEYIVRHTLNGWWSSMSDAG